MKSKKRHHSSSDESEEDDSEVSARSSSSESDSDDSSASEHRHKKKKKHADSSQSDSDSDDHRRSKKRKHKKKKKKHTKRRRRSESEDVSASGAEDVSSISEGEVSPKKKRNKKHRKRSRSSSVRIIEEDRKERRLHSVVKERKRSPAQEERPVRTYYQKEYHRPASPVVNQDRVQEVQRFYRGSSKERRFQEQLQYDARERNQRFPPYQDVAYPNRNTFHHNPQFSVQNDDYQREKTEFQCQRNSRYEGHRSQPEEFQRRPREETYNPREEPRGYHRYNQYEERGPKRREFDEGRDYREKERRGPPEPDRYREREAPERRERYREEPFHSDRARDARREKPPGRPERPPPPPPPPPPPQHKHESRSHSVEERDRYRERNKRPEPKQDREDRYRESRDRGDERRERQSDDRRADRGRTEDKPESRPRERKSRFADGENEKDYNWGKTEVKKEGEDPAEKEKPNFGLSGKLTADTNTVNGVVIKYTEPDDAKQPKRRWRFYPFKGDKALPILYIHRQSAFLIGRDKKVVDIMLEHPSISKQHAALQYRATPFTRADGTQGRRVRPYVIDLESANGTFVNNKKIEPRRYVELLEKDVVKFGFSAREYVLLHENSKDDAQDDDSQEPGALGAGVTTADKVKHAKRVKQEVAEDGE